MSVTPVVCLLVLAGAGGLRAEGEAEGPAAEDPRQAPLPSGLVEQATVHLIQAHMSVLDRQGHPVPGLGPEDFVLLAGGKPRTIDVFDDNCPAESLSSLGPGAGPGTGPDSEPRRFVLAFDYVSFTRVGYFGAEIGEGLLGRNRALAAATDFVRERMEPGDQMMLIAMRGFDVRVETPFTSDTELLLDRLERMRVDTSLYARHMPAPSHPNGWTGTVRGLLDILTEVPGHKSIIYFTEGGAFFDPYLDNVRVRALAADAQRARARFFPVKPSGLAPGSEPRDRASFNLALVTGGSYTRWTNDLGKAWEAAERSLSCLYTLGHYLDPEEVEARVKGYDREKQMGRRRYSYWYGGKPATSIDVTPRRKGLRLSLARAYQPISVEEAEDRLEIAALQDPTLLGDLKVRGFLIPLFPEGRKRWRAALVAEVSEAGGGDLSGEVGAEGMVWRKSTVAWQGIFPLTVRDSHPREERALFGTTLEAKPGEYEMSVLSTSGDGARQGAYKEDRRLPEVPAPGRPGPSVLAEAATTGGILDVGPPVAGSGERPPGFFPLIVQAFESEDEVLALTPYCRPRTGRAGETGAVGRPGRGRVLTAPEEGEPESVAELGLNWWDAGGGCGLLWTRIAPSSLPPGHYLYALEGREKEEPLEFTVLR
jgi:VWFA-related protein